jgi:hypothetical protein
MKNNVKIALISFGVLSLGVGTFFLIRYIKLKKSYQTTLDINQAQQLINQKTANVDDKIIPDDVTRNADLPKGTIGEISPSIKQDDYGNYYDSNNNLIDPSTGEVIFSNTYFFHTPNSTSFPQQPFFDTEKELAEFEKTSNLGDY